MLKKNRKILFKAWLPRDEDKNFMTNTRKKGSRGGILQKWTCGIDLSYDEKMPKGEPYKYEIERE